MQWHWVQERSQTAARPRHWVQEQARRQNSQSRLALAEFLLPLEIAPFDDATAAAYGNVRAALEKKGKSIGPLDTLIAAHALALGAVLVTHNTREFARVPGLSVEDWVA